MTLDASTRRNLELDETLLGERKGSLLGVLDQTITAMGKRAMHQWVGQPLLSVEKIESARPELSTFLNAVCCARSYGMHSSRWPIWNG